MTFLPTILASIQMLILGVIQPIHEWYLVWLSHILEDQPRMERRYPSRRRGYLLSISGWSESMWLCQPRYHEWAVGLLPAKSRLTSGSVSMSVCLSVCLSVCPGVIRVLQPIAVQVEGYFQPIAVQVKCFSANRRACLSILASDWLTGISPWLCRYNHDFTIVVQVLSWFHHGCASSIMISPWLFRYNHDFTMVVQVQSWFHHGCANSIMISPWLCKSMKWTPM